MTNRVSNKCSRLNTTETIYWILCRLRPPPKPPTHVTSAKSHKPRRFHLDKLGEDERIIRHSDSDPIYTDLGSILARRVAPNGPRSSTPASRLNWGEQTMDIEPPSYSEVTNDEEYLLPSTTLQISGHVIYSDKAPTEPLYELSHEPIHLRDTTRSMTVKRLDTTIKSSPASDGRPSHAVTQKRHIYDLKHPGILTGPVFLYNAEAVSRHSLGSFGMSTYRPRLFSSADGFRVHRAVKRLDNQLVARGLLFSAVSTKTSAVRYEWSDGKGEILARELNTSYGCKLFITKEMTVKKRDALVAAWVLRMWWEIAGSGDYEL